MTKREIHGVVLCPTKNNSNLTIRTKTKELMYSYKVFGNNDDVNINQNIHFTSVSPIHKGCWYYDVKENKVCKARKYMNASTSKLKIVASTDQTLGLDIYNISEAFIMLYEKSYNKGTPIKEVELTLEKCSMSSADGCETEDFYEPKVNSKNEVKIRLIEDTTGNPSPVKLTTKSDETKELHIVELKQELQYFYDKERTDQERYNAIIKNMLSKDDAELLCKKAIWDYINSSSDLKGTSFENGLSTSIKTVEETKISKWFDKQIKNK